jgi:hypothetical protein
MTNPNILPSAQNHSFRWISAAIAIPLLAAAAACASKAASPPTPGASPSSRSASRASASGVKQTCPDQTDGPTIVAGAVEDAHRVWVANPSTPLPPPCVFTAYSRLSGPMPDSLDAHALALVAESRRRGASERELLAAEVGLFARARRYTEVIRTYDRLVTVDPQPAVDVSRLALAAARQKPDTAALIRILTKAATHPEAGPLPAGELKVLRAVGPLWAAINEAKGLVRQSPKNVTPYPSLVGNFGTLGLPDSVATYLRRALAVNAPRASLSQPLDLLVTTMLRHATLYGNANRWDVSIVGASRVDSTLSTPSTKFLVAALIVHSAQPEIASISSAVEGSPILGRAASQSNTQERAEACQRLAPLETRLSMAESRMNAGGKAYAGGGAAQVGSAIMAVRNRIVSLEEQCGRPSGMRP